MFARLDPGASAPALTFLLDGEPVAACPGETVAQSLLAAGVLTLRETPVAGNPRGPFCLMGICFDCLVEIDGVANRQACVVEVREAMDVRTRRGRT